MTPDSRIAFDYSFLAFTFLLIGLRLWVGLCWRRKDNRKRTFSEKMCGWLSVCSVVLAGLCLAATIATTTWAMVQIKNYQHLPSEMLVPGLGLPPKLSETSLKMIFAVKFNYVFGMWFVKTAFLCMFFELRSHLSHRLRKALYTAMIYTFFTFVLVIGLTAGWCRPVASNWDPEINGKICSSYHNTTVITVMTIANITTDIAVITIPFFVVRSFELRRREYWATAFVFFLGAICIITAVIRYGFCLQFIYDKTANGTPTQTNPIMITSQLELAIAIWTACLPSMRILLRGTIGNSIRSRSAHDGSGAGSGAIPRKPVYGGSFHTGLTSYDSEVDLQLYDSNPNAPPIRIP